MSEPRAAIARRLKRQARVSAMLDSPLYELLLDRAADDVVAGGPVAAVLEGRHLDPPGSALGLRLMAAVHRLVLDGTAPVLAAFYPSVGGHVDPARVWPAFIETVAERADELHALAQRPCQTNEVRRSAALLGGFLLVAGRTGLGLRVLEVGSSAGLNLRWDRYRYRFDGSSWGPPDSLVELRTTLLEGEPPLESRAEVVERRGCDASPLDPTSESDRITLLAQVWGDQVERIQLLRSALEAAAEDTPPVDRANAVDWVEEQLAHPVRERATVVFHSIVMQYLDDAARRRFQEAVERAGDRATERAPLAWLRMERAGELADVRLAVWPGGEDRLIAQASYHGATLRWLGG